MEAAGPQPTGWLRVLQQLPIMSVNAALPYIYAPNASTINSSLFSTVSSESESADYSPLPSDIGATVMTDDSDNSSNSPNWRHPALAVLMATFCVTTVAGNCLVVLAVCTKKYLRNPTGYLIVSLAFADLIVGLVVMPLNSLFEMTRHVWLLGLTMCDLFHALDILASTSSIWNLCVISLDRYMAGQDPIGYRDKVSTHRIMLAIVFVWVISACLSFPAIIWWRQSSPHLYLDQNKCLFTDSRLYVIFSSLVSFYIPLILILFAYGRVFLIATRHSRSLKSGIKKVKCKKAKKTDSESAVSEDNMPTLRIHFGRGKKTPTGGAIVSVLANAAVESSSRLHTSIRLPKSPALSVPTPKPWLRQSSCKSLLAPSTEIASPCLNGGTNVLRPDSRTSNKSMNTVGVPRGPRPPRQPGLPPRTASMMTVLPSEDTNDASTCLVSPTSTEIGLPPSVRKKMGVREKSRQMMKYVHEQRAARTLSIVVGAFILCWMPFFIFSPLIAICKTCVGNQDQVFSFITWAGHLNSMLNPLIYSRFSRDFRRAFKQILTCQRERPMKKAIKTPLNIVFAQLVSITQFWEQPQASECQVDTAPASFAE
uniref:G_PROTEIN_RECEP_F1_2 domain-containing protein n=1 Tax=Panagrellus redivivus TaxID=6233 RepID=A0A7E4V8R7_PANRE